jgi:hypothetical protein
VVLVGMLTVNTLMILMVVGRIVNRIVVMRVMMMVDGIRCFRCNKLLDKWFIIFTGEIYVRVCGSCLRKDKPVDDDYLFLLQQELKTRKAVRSTLKERLNHEDHLIIDIEKKILEYVNGERDITKHTS